MATRLDRDVRAVTTLEYALIATFMTIIVGGAAHSLGTGIGQTFRVVADAVMVAESPLSVSSN